MSKEKETEEFYQRLEEELNKSAIWPAEYLFKFIVPSAVKNIEEVEQHFNNQGAVIKTNTSKEGKYTSVSINLIMESPKEIIKKYKELSHIEGIISL